jgi:hypothetical protein
MVSQIFRRVGSTRLSGVSEGHSKALTGHDAPEANIFVSVYLYAIMIGFT